MTGFLLLAALSVLPADRLAMADRLFNKGEYAAAEVEYAALKGEASLAADEILYRLAECARATNRGAEAARRYAALVESTPDSRYAGASRLQLALDETNALERVRRLTALDTDRVESSVRAAALYHLGEARADAALLLKCETIDPNGRYAPYAKCRRGALLTESTDLAVRRKGVGVLLEVAFGKSPLASEAMFLAASVSYREKKYSEAGSLFRRYLKLFPKAARADEARVLSVWCDYLEGRYADAAAACGAAGTDDLAYLKASCAAQTDDATKAAALLRKYLEDYPTGRYREDAALQLARLEFTTATSRKDSAAIVEAARRAAAKGGAMDRLRLAWAYEHNSQLAEADAEYVRLIRDFPGSDEAAQALYARAMAAARANDWAKCELLLAEMLATGKAGAKAAEANYWRGVAALRLGHDAEAARSLAEALKLSLPLDEAREARLMLADYAFRQGRVDEAKAAYEKLVREGACERMSAAKIHEVGRLLGGESAEICARALTAGKSAEWRQTGWTMQGAAEEARQSFSRAIASYRKALAEPVKTESAARAALALGKLELRAGETAAAEATLKEAVTLNAADPRARGEAYLALAENAVARGDVKGAKGYATVVVSLFSDRALVDPAEKILKSLSETPEK